MSWRLPRKIAFWTIFLSAPLPTPPRKTQILFLLSSRFLWTTQNLVVWWNLRWSFGGKCFWRFSPAKEARKSPSKLRRKFATPPISPKTSPTSLWKSLVTRCLRIARDWRIVSREIVLEKVQGGTRLGATGLRASEREICLWEGLWEDLWKPLKISDNLRKPLKKTSKTSENLWPSQSSLSEALGPVAPIHLPLKLSPILVQEEQHVLCQEGDSLKSLQVEGNNISWCCPKMA